MYCPECGHDAGDARFCPECGANLAGVKEALSGRPAATAAGKDEAQTAAQPAAGPQRLSPAVVWGAFAALAVVVILVVVMVSGGFGKESGEPAAEAGDGSTTTITADTSGSYEELVQRANELYDQGDAAFQQQDMERGGAHFAAAAQVYAAAWAKQATDPGVGTDYAVALFYSGDIDAALKQIEAVLRDNPDFQKGWLNKGIFLTHEGRIVEQEGDKQQAEKMYRQAKTALTKAVAIDPESETGKQADESLQALSMMQ